MANELLSLGSLLVGTLTMRPYVFGFLLMFVVAASRDIGRARTFGFLAWGFAVAFAAEYVSTRIGIPFGLYDYTGSTAGAELFLSNVPLFSPPSFAFLAYAAFCLARWTLGERRELGVVFLSGILMMLLDVVIDPLAVRGDRWFLGRIFSYPAGGLYFGVPLSNFGGWVLVGWGIVGGYVWAARRRPAPADFGRSPFSGVGLYYAVLFFNLGITVSIGEWELFFAGILVHVAGFLLLYGLSAASASRRIRAGSEDASASRRAGSASP